MSVLAAVPMSVPSVLKMSINTNTKTVSIISTLSSAAKSSFKNVGAMLWGSETGTKASGIWVMPIGMPITVHIKML